MRILSNIITAFITMSAVFSVGATASVALAMTIPGVTGPARTAGIRIGETKASLILPTGKSALTLQCGLWKSEVIICLRPAKIGNIVADSPYQEKDNGKTVSIPVGKRFTIELTENPTTGYEWSEPTFDEMCLSLESDEYSSKSVGIGGGGARRFVLFGKTACSPTSRLVNRGPAERNVEPQGTF